MTGLILAALLSVQDPAQAMEAREFQGAGGGKLLYRLYKPKEAEAGKKLPLLLFLHGAGERGNDNKKQLKNCVGNLLKVLSANPCFLVAPQCPDGKRWVEVHWGDSRHDTPEKPSDAMGLTIELLAALQKEFPVDGKRIYVTGLSMGGFGTWDILVRCPDLFAAAIPVCGGGDDRRAAEIAKVPQWVFHGDKDTAVPTARSRAMVEALKKAGGSPKYTEYPGVGHNCWDKAYGEADLFPWLFAQKKP